MKVFIYSTDSPHIGGDQSYEACFLELGVHIPFISHTKTVGIVVAGGSLKFVGEPKKCDNSCCNATYGGWLKDWSAQDIINGHSVEPIIKKAHSL